MGAVSSILEFKERSDAPTLVLVDLHDDRLTGIRADRPDYRAALDQCRTALTFARANGMPVAFVRHTATPPSFLASYAYPCWLADLRPQRSDMVFERPLPSCFASSEFAQMARCSKELVLAGLFGETSCLATLVEGYGRNHLFTYLADGSVSRGRDDLPAEEMHRGVLAIASFYCQISSTEAWMERMSRKLCAAV